jgi:serine/threonine protein kinase
MHDAGWIHRDVKPDNLLVDEKGTTKLIDFSIAQPRYSGIGGFFAGFTKSSTIQGTRSYMAPEQIRNEVVDVTADMYSFGCTIYELLARKVPYTAVNSDELLTKHLRSAVPVVASANTSVTPEMSSLVQRMMAKNKEQRPQSMKDFLDEFKHLSVFKAPK